MFTASIIAALVAAGVATAKAIGKGVQAKRQRESRETEQQRHLSAAEQVAQQTEEYRGQYQQQQMAGMRAQMQQMQPLQDAMTRAYGGSAGYQAPDMSWLMQPQSRSYQSAEPLARETPPKPKPQRTVGAQDPTSPGGPTKKQKKTKLSGTIR